MLSSPPPEKSESTSSRSRVKSAGLFVRQYMQLVSTLDVVSAPAEMAKLASVVIWPKVGLRSVGKEPDSSIYIGSLSGIFSGETKVHTRWKNRSRPCAVDSYRALALAIARYLKRTRSFVMLGRLKKSRDAQGSCSM